MDHVNHQNDLNDKDIHKVTGEHDEAEEHRPFPTLVEAFQNVSDEVGFNIEVKYPMMQIVCFSFLFFLVNYLNYLYTLKKLYYNFITIF